jgi:predicted DNA-binding mobile mystery protein A
MSRMADNRPLARRRLDERLEPLKSIASLPRPHRGWIRAIRDALGISSAELAARMGVAQQRIAQLEQNEVGDRIQLGTLRQAADALDCDLFYVLLPRTSLDEAVQRQARLKAAAIVGRVAHHSRLEDQSLTRTQTDEQVDQLAERLIDRRGLWRELERRR